MTMFELSEGFAGLYPWQQQYFERQKVPDDVVVPLKDPLAWELYPRHRWVYNKMLICETQGLAYGPHGTRPEQYPVFSKPICNLLGMGQEIRVVADEHEYADAMQPGHFWMPLFKGRHVSTDVALEHGTPRWWQHTTGVPGREPGTFDYWIVHADAAPLPALESYLSAWITKHLQGYTGYFNIETIGGRIIECHLRMTAQWPDLNGAGFLDAVATLYARGVWRFDHKPNRDGYSVALFAPHGNAWSIDRQAVARLLPAPDVSSIQLTFDEFVAPEHHNMPVGGFRLAVINCWDLDAGKRMRETLRGMFVPRPPPL